MTFDEFLARCISDCVEATGQGRLNGVSTMGSLPGSRARDNNAPEGAAASRGMAEAKNRERACHVCGGDHTDPRDQEIRALQQQLEARAAELREAKGHARVAFVEGAAWWEFESSGATIWQEDRHKAEAEAAIRYPGLDWPLNSLRVRVAEHTAARLQDENASLREQLQRAGEALRLASEVTRPDPLRAARERWARDDGEIDPGGRERP